MWNFGKMVLMMLVMSMLCSCAGMLGDGRMQAWKDVRVAEEKTEQEFLQTKSVELAIANTDTKKQNPTLKITTQDSAGNPVIVEMDLQPVVAELTGKIEEPETYGIDMSTTPMPEGEFAEGMKATGKAATEIASSPAVLVGTSGYFTREIISAVGGGTEINADTATFDGSFNSNEVHATGDSNSASLAISQESDEDGGE